MKRKAMADDTARLRGPRDDHVAKFPVPELVVVAAHLDGRVFVEELGPGNRELTLFHRWIWTVPVLHGPHADDGDTSGGVYEFRDGFGNPVRVLAIVVCPRASLKSNKVERAAHTAKLTFLAKCRARSPLCFVLPDLLDGIATKEIDRNRAKLPGLIQALRGGVNRIHSRRAAKLRGISGEQAYSACAEDRDSVAGSKINDVTPW